MCDKSHDISLVYPANNGGDVDILSIPISSKIPHYLGKIDLQDNMPLDLYGSEILKFGSVGKGFEGGGLGLENPKYLRLRLTTLYLLNLSDIFNCVD